MRYYIKELLNQNYEIVAMDGYDAYVSIYNHEDIHLTSQQKETVSCSTVDNQYYYGIGQEECHDYCQIAQYLDMDPLRFYNFIHHHVIMEIIKTFLNFKTFIIAWILEKS